MEITIPNNEFSKIFFKGWSGNLSFHVEGRAETYQCTCKSRYLLKNGTVRVKFDAKRIDNLS